jgi:uncharacterized membrane protein
MNPGEPGDLEGRVARLERMVAEIHARLPPRAGAPPTVSAPPPAPSPAHPRREERWAHWSEQWVGRVGLGLLFLGLVYLFNYSIEQGWITPLVRVAVGLAIASTLLLLGLRFQSGRRSFSQLLLAGALGVYYVSGFAAFQLYHLVSYGAAFGYMAAVMALGLALARRQDHPSLASLGALGGLVTPLLLHRASPAVVELSVYTTLVVCWTAVLYWLRGWPSLLWTYAAGGLAALSVAAEHASGRDRAIVQVALSLTWAAGAALPFVRGVRQEETRATLRRAWGRIPAVLQLRALGVGGTSAALFLTDTVWKLPDRTLGALFLAVAALYAALARFGTRLPNLVAGTAAPVAAALCATGTYLVVHDDAARVAILSAEALCFVFAGRLPRFPGLAGVGQTLFAVLAGEMLIEAMDGPRVAMDPLAWSQLATLVLALPAARFSADRRVSRLFYLAAHALFLVWLAKELGPIAKGTGLVTLAWGAYGAALLFLALLWRDRRGEATHALQLVALSAVALAVGKLVAVDLQRVAILWRICLFMGFGIALLVLSSLFKPTRERPGGELEAEGTK